MSAHPSRSGAISAQLFAEFIDTLQGTIDEETPDGLSFHKLHYHILKAALRVAIQRASRKFHWPRAFSPNIGVDAGGSVYDDGNSSTRLSASSLQWIQAEVQKIAKHALAALEGANS